MLKRDRQALLDDLGDHRLEVAWDPIIAFATGMCLFMGLLFLIGPLLVPLLSNDKDVRIALWVSIPLPFSIAAGLWYRHQNSQRKIAFSKSGFEVSNRNVSTFSCRWDEIEFMKKFRQTLTIAKTDGMSVKVVIPQVKSCRNRSWFNAIIDTYLQPQDAKGRAKKLAKFSLGLSLVCLIFVLGLGQPRMMKPDQDIPFAVLDYLHLGVWAIAVTGAIIGAIGIFGFLESLGTSTSKVVESEPKNDFEVRVEKNFGWLETIEMEPGRNYRYVEPDGLKKALRAQRMGLLAIIITLLVMTIGLSALVLSDPRARASSQTFLVFLMLLVLALVVSIFPGYHRFAIGTFVVDDELSLDGEFLVVRNASGVKKYDWKMCQSVGEITKIQGTAAPFSRIEWVGSKPDRYMLDRRYLVEFEKEDDL